MRRATANFGANTGDGVHRVVASSDLAGQWTAELQFLVLAKNSADREVVERLLGSGISNVGWVESNDLQLNDVVVARTTNSAAFVQFRESDVHHTLFLTNRCNSYCLMCSQPPTAHDDSWLVDQAIDVLRHMRSSPAVLGISGGEPLLLGASLRSVLDEIAALHGETVVEVLTNGRMLADAGIVRVLLDDLKPRVSWLVPLYGHADFVHDFVVQSPGAFDETLSGLLVLQEHRQPIQLRIVLIEPVLQILPELCAFIGRNLPFVREVALMGCEPTGFALANRDHCAVDLMDWGQTLDQGTRVLARFNVRFLLMNLPLCALPRSLWEHAHKSISDWKNVYVDECSRCAVKERCSGLFASHARGWTPTRVRAFEEMAP